MAAFGDGLRSAMDITERFKNAILCQVCDSICLMNKAIKAELNKAYRQNVVYGYVFMNGMDAVEIYRAGAEWDIPENKRPADCGLIRTGCLKVSGIIWRDI